MDHLNCVVPLAGPDFYIKSTGIAKPLYEYEGKRIIERTLFSREWYGNELIDENIIFVLCGKNEGNEDFLNYISLEHPNCKYIIVSDHTQGALLSAMCALPMLDESNRGLVIDLADIEYTLTGNKNIFANESWAGVVPYFISEDLNYSYLQLDSNNRILKAIEKQVISKNASAGTYFVRNINILYEKVTEYLASEYAFNGSYYVCPVYNLIEDAYGFQVEMKNCFSTYFKKLG